METFWQDLRYSLRVTAKAPGFVAVAVLALALGIGANTAIFSVVNAVLLRALPYKDASRLVWATNSLPPQRSMPARNLVFSDVYIAWSRQSRVFEDISAYSFSGGSTLTGVGASERLNTARVTASFLRVLGISPRLGRNFLPEEDRPRGARAVLLSDALWRTRFGGDPTVLGRVIALDSKPYTIAGVLPPNFEFPENSNPDALVPLQLVESSVQVAPGDRVTIRIEALNVIARLRPGKRPEDAQNELAAINRSVAKGLPAGLADSVTRGQARVSTLHDHLVGNVRPALLVLLGAVGFVLLIACANVANLQLARGVARQREVAIRSALGAGKGRLARLLLTESTVVALAGGMAGLLLAAWAIRLIRHFGPPSIPHLANASLNLPVLFFTLALALLTGLAFGLAPVLAAFRISLNDTLKDIGAHGGRGSRKPQKVLVVTEIALSLVLFIGAGLLVRSFLRLTSVQMGFDPRGVLTADVSLPADAYATPQQQKAFFERMIERVRDLPGVTSAGTASALPFRRASMISSIEIEGQPQPNIPSLSLTQVPVANINVVTPGYFSALRTLLLAGRFLEDRDAAGGAAKMVAVNQAFVQRFFTHAEDPVGHRVRVFGNDFRTIVGVVADIKQRNLADEVTPEVFLPEGEVPMARTVLVVRSSVDPMSLVSAVRQQVAGLDPNVPLSSVQTLDDTLAAETATQRFNAGALAAFAVLAVLLAAVGIYGVMTYVVGERTREIGVRLALGAEPGDVLRLVLAEGLWMALLGVALGLGASFGLTRLMRSLLFEVRPADPATFAVVTAALVFAGLAACWIPARRAMRVDPIVTLRYE